ncbi:MAG: hypothetical protein N3D20_02890 [Candidatus Pacearchaeota archaeon]|nr:hypothetical protein [Candidatus Pacearchaeota archaeon]
MNKNKVRINITVDREKLEKAKTKLNLFGGKLSTLFNAYLTEFVESMSRDINNKNYEKRFEDIERRLRRIETMQNKTKHF